MLGLQNQEACVFTSLPGSGVRSESEKLALGVTKSKAICEGLAAPDVIHRQLRMHGRLGTLPDRNSESQVLRDVLKEHLHADRVPVTWEHSGGLEHLLWNGRETEWPRDGPGRPATWSASLSRPTLATLQWQLPGSPSLAPLPPVQMKRSHAPSAPQTLCF